MTAMYAPALGYGLAGSPGYMELSGRVLLAPSGRELMEIIPRRYVDVVERVPVDVSLIARSVRTSPQSPYLLVPSAHLTQSAVDTQRFLVSADGSMQYSTDEANELMTTLAYEYEQELDRLLAARRQRDARLAARELTRVDIFGDIRRREVSRTPGIFSSLRPDPMRVAPEELINQVLAASQVVPDSARSRLMDEFLQQIAQSSPYTPRERVTVKDETGRKVSAAAPEPPRDFRARKVARRRG